MGTSEHKCNSCFYMQNERDRAPCVNCTGYDKYVTRNVYIKQWDNEDAFDKNKEDVVNHPKHYMLFKEKGIEVRDVIEKLVSKLCPFDDGMFIADYVQMMQYLMRFMDKNGVEDLKKAQWYLNKLIEAYDVPDL